MFKNLTKEGIIKNKETIVDMILMEIGNSEPKNINSGYILELNDINAAEFYNKNNIEIDILLLGGILEGLYGFTSDLYQTLLEENGTILTWFQLQPLFENKYIKFLYDKIMENAKNKNNSGEIVGRAIESFINKLGQELDKLNPEELEGQIEVFKQLSKEIQESAKTI